jgi:hypothetical protein
VITAAAAADAALGGQPGPETLTDAATSSPADGEVADVLAGTGLAPEEAAAAATKIQAVTRGNQARRELLRRHGLAGGELADAGGVDAGDTAGVLAGMGMPEAEATAAATRIQAIRRQIEQIYL